MSQTKDESNVAPSSASSNIVSESTAPTLQGSRVPSVLNLEKEAGGNVEPEEEGSIAEKQASILQEVPEDNSQYPTGWRLGAIVIGLILSIFLVALDMTIVATAIPRITDEFHSLSQVGWYGSAFFLTLASFQSTWGKAYKYFPIKPAFLLSIIIFELGSLICAVAPNSTTLIIGRAIAGAGGAGVASGAYTIIAFSASPKRRPAFTGLLGATYGCASVIGPLLGGVFTEKISWRWCFYINLPVGGAAAAMIFLIVTLPEAAKPVQAKWTEKLLQMDLAGTFLIMAAVVCYLLALQWGGVTKLWSDGSVIGTLVGFVLLVIIFLVNEYFMGERALLQARILKKRMVAVAVVYISLLAGAFFMILYYLPIYFQAVSGTSPSDSGIRNIPLVLGTSLFTIISGSLISVYGHYVPIMIAASTFGTIGSGLIFTLGIDSPSSQWIGYQVIAGIGFGLGIQVPIIVAQAAVDVSDISAVSAIVLFFQTVGGSFFVSAGQAAFANKLVGSIPTTNPGLDPQRVVNTGATMIRTAFAASEIPGILQSYLNGLQTVYLITVVLVAISLLAALAAPWKRINASGAAAAA